MNKDANINQYSYEIINSATNIRDDLLMLKTSFNNLSAESLDNFIETLKTITGKITYECFCINKNAEAFSDSFITFIKDSKLILFSIFEIVSKMIPEEISAANDIVEKSSDCRLYNLHDIIEDMLNCDSMYKFGDYSINDDSMYTKNKIVFKDCRELIDVYSVNTIYLLNRAKRSTINSIDTYKNKFPEILFQITDIDPNEIDKTSIAKHLELICSFIDLITIIINRYTNFAKFYNAYIAHSCICYKTINEFNENRYKF